MDQIGANFDRFSGAHPQRVSPIADSARCDRWRCAEPRALSDHLAGANQSNDSPTCDRQSDSIELSRWLQRVNREEPMTPPPPSRPVFMSAANSPQVWPAVPEGKLTLGRVPPTPANIVAIREYTRTRIVTRAEIDLIG